MNNLSKETQKNQIRYTPTNVMIEVTLKCNFNCIHCGSSAGKARENELSLQEIKKLLDNLKKLGTKGISLIGGEVFLRSDWEEIVRYIIKNGFFCAIITNGYLLSQDLIRVIKDAGVLQLGISLDAASENIYYQIRRKKNGFIRAIQAIELSLKYNIPVTTVITSINKININELNPLFNLLSQYDRPIDWQIKLCSNHNIDRFADKYIIDEKDFLQTAAFISHTKFFIKTNNLKISISEAHDIGYYSESFSNISEDWKGCLAGLETMGIQSNGNVKGCLALPDSFIEGNIRETSIVTLWNDPDKFKYSRNFSKENLPLQCKFCIKSELCRGGCTDFSYSLTYHSPFCLYQIEQKLLSTDDDRLNLTGLLKE